MRSLVLIILFLLSVPLISLGQDPSNITLKASRSGTTIKLRWAPSSPSLWKQMNKLGVQVERHTIVRNKEILSQPEVKILYENLKARPLKEWELIVQESDKAAIIAQALYGEDFQLSGGKDLSTIVAISEDLEQRYAMSLYAADQSFEAALMAGWGIVDSEVKINERYLYKVKLALESGIEGVLFVAGDEVDELPKPSGLAGVWGDKSVMLVWNYGLLKNYYNSYTIERSVDGINFKQLDGIPVTNLNNKEENVEQRMYFIDSLPDNQNLYFYRIKGINSFGEFGPPSDSLVGSGKNLLRYTPGIIRSEINQRGELELEWEFERDGNSLINGFTINRSEDSDKGYFPYIENISPSLRSLVHKKVEASNYFTITAVAKDGQSTTSFPVFVQAIDSIPPATPMGLSGVIDSLGHVKLNWANNKEVDLLGYKVYKAFLPNQELIELNSIALKDTVYKESVDLYNLNPLVYYAISSVDNRYNQSGLSDVLILKKPDKIKPIPPVISSYKISSKGIQLEWINSPDTSVVYHRVYRQEKSENFTLNQLLQTISDKQINFYIDTTASKGVKYIYTLTSVKKNWLESESSNAITLFTNRGKGLLEIDKFNAIVDKPNRMLKLLWVDKLIDVASYEIYKAENGSKPQLWKVLPSGSTEIIDEKLYVNTRYKYYIRALLKNGSYTKMKEIEIIY